VVATTTKHCDIRMIGEMPPQSAPSTSGIIQHGDERVVPASVRPDGTVRREIHIRAGYVPQEDVAKYTNRRVEAANFKPQYPVGYVPPKEEEGAKKSKKKKSKKPKEPEKPNEEQPLIDFFGLTLSPPSQPQDLQTEAEPIDPIKRAKVLEKKLRQIEQLKERTAKGEILLPEQLEKLDKVAEIEEELAKLKV